MRTLRRAINFGQHVKKHLIPLLIYVKDAKIIDVTLRIFVHLTIPINCLFPGDIIHCNDINCHGLIDIKEAFADFRDIQSIIGHMRTILDNEQQLTFFHCDSINNCLLLLRNLLYIPDAIKIDIKDNNQHVKTQNKILWHMFALNIDKVLLELMVREQKTAWTITIVQLIALMYKDQDVNSNQLFDETITDNCEDVESNTSTPKHNSNESSRLLTSDEPTDSSDDEGN